MRATAPLVALLLALAACGDDEPIGTTEAPGDLTTAQREWCSFSGTGEDDALRFDLIFESGLALGLNMDSVNAIAAESRAEYEAEGMTSAEAVQAVSDDLFESEAFVLACRQAYATNVSLTDP